MDWLGVVAVTETEVEDGVKGVAGFLFMENFLLREGKFQISVVLVFEYL